MMTQSTLQPLKGAPAQAAVHQVPCTSQELCLLYTSVTTVPTSPRAPRTHATCCATCGCCNVLLQHDAAMCRYLNTTTNKPEYSNNQKGLPHEKPPIRPLIQVRTLVYMCLHCPSASMLPVTHNSRGCKQEHGDGRATQSSCYCHSDALTRPLIHVKTFVYMPVSTAPVLACYQQHTTGAGSCKQEPGDGKTTYGS